MKNLDKACELLLQFYLGEDNDTTYEETKKFLEKQGCEIVYDKTLDKILEKE